MAASVVFHIECRYGKPVNTRVQGAPQGHFLVVRYWRTTQGTGRRQGWFPCQGLQRGNRVLTGFPLGATRKASAVLRPLEIAPLSPVSSTEQALRGRALQLSFWLRLYLHSI